MKNFTHGRKPANSPSFTNMQKKGSCRFNYPKPPSPSTIISHEPQDNSSQKVEFAVKILTVVNEVIDSKDLHADITLQEILEAAHVTLDDYITSIRNQ